MRVADWAQEVAHWLPQQGPLKDFIHHNTLHAFQDFPFFEGCRRAGQLYGARAYLPLSHYRRMLADGRISPELLAHRAREVAGEQAQPLLALLDQSEEEFIPRPLTESGIRHRWKERGLALNLRTHPLLFRLISQYLDQGISLWRMPHREESFYQCVGRLVRSSWFPLQPFSSPALKAYFERPPEMVIQQILQRFLGDPAHEHRYLLEMSLAHPGWSGMVATLEAHPEALVHGRKATLIDFWAVELVAELGFVTQAFGKAFSPLTHSGESFPALPYQEDKDCQPSPLELLQQICQEALEATWSEKVLVQLTGRPLPPAAEVQPEVQAFFCIDDRECSLRRHLEALHPSIETLGFAGFFGVDCFFQGSQDAFPFKHCPAPVQPTHLIREVSTKVPARAGAGLPHESDPHSHSLWQGFLITHTLGLWAAVKLALSLFRPTLSPLTASSLRRVDPEAQLQVEASGLPSESGLTLGYSDEEMADRVGGLLQASGALSRGLSPLICLFGHGASSVNNPYFAAYDCGACSGKAGGPNARALALMANRPQVRTLLRRRGLEIPESTWFVGALHDTTRDEVQYYDLEQVPGQQRERLSQLQSCMRQALGLNAQERCHKFARLASQPAPARALQLVRRRSISLFEPRPELNHATNAACIVARRQLTRGLNLARRTFLNSYDPVSDPEGKTLTQILSAVVPVCGGINLEYYFSRLDSKVYGAGSKLPHNINGLLGVMNGTEGDLLTGLPSQMTELHDPMRLLLLVEQDPEVALQAAQRNPAVYGWIAQGWVNLAAIDLQRRVWQFQAGRMQPWKAGQS